MLKVKDIMCKNVVTAKENLSILDAVRLLNERHVGSMVVVNDENKCIGIFTERDAIRVVAQKISLDEPINKVMTTRIATISFEASLNDAKELLLSHKIRHLPVTDKEGKLVGLFSFRAFVDEVFSMEKPAQPI